MKRKSTRIRFQYKKKKEKSENFEFKNEFLQIRECL